MNTILSQLSAENYINDYSGSSNKTVKKETAETSGRNDTALVSDAAKAVSSSGLDLSASSASYIKDSLQYNLVFNSSETASLSASGFYYRKDKSFSMNLSFQFQKEVEEGGIKSLKTFQANLNFNASFTKEVSANPYTNKEDIGKFIQKLVKRISESITDDKQNLTGVLIDKEDFADIAGIDKGKLAKVLVEIINMAILTERMKKMMEKDAQDSENVILHPEREKESGIEINDNTVNISDLSIEITEIKPEENASEESV